MDLLNGKLLDTVIKRVDDIELAVTVKCEPVRGIELAGFGPRFSEASQVGAVTGELLDATTHGAHPDSIMLVNANADRPLESCLAILETGEDAAEFARFLRIAAPGE